MSRIIINGVKLPEKDANVRSIINNIVIYDDGTFVAVRGSNLIEGSIPSNGEINIDGMRIKVSGCPYDSNSDIRISSSGVSISGSSSSDSSSLDNMIEKSFELRAGYKINLSNVNSNVNLDLIPGTELEIKGTVLEEPISVHGSKLFIKGLNGSLYLPKCISELELSLKSINGNIIGKVQHPGSIITTNGNIDLVLASPMGFEAITLNGTLDIKGAWAYKGKYYHNDSDTNDDKLLSLSTVNGNIKVRYLESF